MHNVLMVIRREYLDRVRKKSFWIGTLVFPLIMVTLVLGPMALTRLSSGPKKIAVVDATGRLFTPMQDELARRGRENAADTADKSKKSTPPPPTGLVLESVPLQGTVEATYAALKPRVNK